MARSLDAAVVEHGGHGNGAAREVGVVVQALAHLSRWFDVIMLDEI